jgi:hypothetical protein
MYDNLDFYYLIQDIKQEYKKAHELEILQNKLEDVLSCLYQYGLSEPLMKFIDPNNHLNVVSYEELFNINKFGQEYKKIIKKLENHLLTVSKLTIKKPVYIVITYTGTWISKLTKFIFNDKYTHAAFSFDLTLRNMYSTQLGDMGIAQESIYDIMLSDTYPFAIYGLTINSNVVTKIKDFIAKAIDNINKIKYNIFGLIGILINKPFASENKFICSEFVIHLLTSFGIKLNLHKHVSLIRPNDISKINSKNLTLIYNGDLKTYKSLNMEKITKQLNL